MRERVDGDQPLSSPAIVWFRDDLRLADNPALAAASASGLPVLAIFVFDDETPELRKLGGAARWWLHGSLEALGASLAERGSALFILHGRADVIVTQVATECRASLVCWNRRYDEPEREQDAAVKTQLKAAGITAKSFNGHLLNEPWDVETKAGTPMKVFTPYWRAARDRGEPTAPLPPPESIEAADWPNHSALVPVSLESLGLKPLKPDWATEFPKRWSPGESGAREKLDTFLASSARNYGEDRNRPDKRSTSRLSPHLRFGEISPRQIWHAAKFASQSGETPASDADITKFLAEVGWREFSYHLLYHFPHLAKANFQNKFDDFPWRDDPKNLRAWQKGQTGYPIVDAGMRELWRTGWMHNRIRMVVASFLIKHLLIDWRLGEEWFWDTLVDADHANNAASWQWVAGSGADAAPYYRIFAPVLQGQKFDPDGLYVRRFVPELAKLSNEFIHRPWEAPHPVLAEAGITLGVNYPFPVIDHQEGRNRALGALKMISGETST